MDYQQIARTVGELKVIKINGSHLMYTCIIFDEFVSSVAVALNFDRCFLAASMLSFFISSK